MNAKGLLILTTVTALAVAGAAYTLREPEAAESDVSAAGHVLPGLLARVNDVSSVEVLSAGETVTLRQTADGWGLAERGDYPVSFTKVKETVMNLANLEIDEHKTALAANHAKLGVEDPRGEGATSSLVVLRDAAEKELAQLVVGESKQNGVLVRRAGEDQVYRSRGTLRLETKPTSWVEREILRLAGDRVDAVTIRHQDGSVIDLARNQENTSQFLVQNLPEGRTEKYAGVANGVGTALSYLALEDVRPIDRVDLTVEPIARATYRCKDGLVLEVELATFEEKKWASLHARYEEIAAPVIGPVAPVEPEEPADPTDADPGDEPATDAAQAEAEALRERTRTEADDLDARLSPWAFQIVDSKATAIAKKMEDLLAAPEEEETDAELDESDFSFDDLLGSDEEPVEDPTEPPVDDPGDSAPATDDSPGQDG